MNHNQVPKTSYDLIPYSSNPFPQSHPDRLATIATLFGIEPPAVEKCRVLELGCASGGNLVPMAEQFPESDFLGIDASTVEVSQGQLTIDRLGLSNVRLECQDIMDFPLTGRQFDYIICHGVYSWVPNHVQERILDICGTCLTDPGVAYVSYNTFPGWHMRYMIRDIMRYRAKSFDSPEQQLAQARGLLSFLTSAVQGEDSPYSILLRKELENINRADDSYLHHEHLEDINLPVYFFEFVDKANKFNLQYLGEADYGSMALGNFPDSTRAMIQGVSRNSVELEQYMDFLRNRGFRQTLLCRKGVLIERAKQEQQLVKLKVASTAKPVDPITELTSPEKTVFKRNQSSLSTNDPQVRAAFIELQKAWPQAIPFPVLASISKSIVTGFPVAVDSDVLSPANHKLAETLLRCYETSMLDLHTVQSSFSLQDSEAPQASPLAKLQAAASSRVTNRAHNTIFLDDLQRQVLMTLDGKRKRDEIAQRLIDRIVQRDLVVHFRQDRIATPEAAKRFVDDNLALILGFLRENSLMIA